MTAPSSSRTIGVLLAGALVGGGATYLVLHSTPAAVPIASTPPSRAPEPRGLGEVSVTLSPEAIARASIVVAPVATDVVGSQISLPGTIEVNTYKQTTVTSLVPGRITTVTAELGQRVRRGDALAEVYSPELTEAQRAYVSGSAELYAHEQQLARTDRLVAIGAASRQELEMAHAEHAALTTNVEGARSRLELLGLSADQVAGLTSASQIVAASTVRAPLDGVVTARQANVGLNVDTAMPLFTVADLSTVWVVGDVYEPDFPRVRVGRPAAITFTAYPEMTLRSAIAYIDPQLNLQTRTAKVRVEVPNPTGQLRLGMYARLLIDSEAGQVVPVVARAAVQTIGERTVVYVADPDVAGRFVERAIHTGAAVGDKVAIVSGLAPGESIVTTGSFFVRAERERLGSADRSNGQK